MRLISRLLISVVAITAIIVFVLFKSGTATAADFVVGGSSLWKLVSGTITPVNPSWSVSVGTFSATTATISGFAVSNLTAPSFTATSTIADSSFQRITWVNATGTRTTSTQLGVLGAAGFGGNVTVQKANATINLCEAAGTPCFGMINDGGSSLRLGGSSFTGLSITDSTVKSYGAFTPVVNNSPSLGSPLLSWAGIYASGTAFLNAVTSTSLQVGHVTSSATISVTCGTAASPGVRGVGAGQDTGFCINTVDQINFYSNGNSAFSFDPSNGLQYSNSRPVSPGSGNIGAISSPFGTSFVISASSTNATTTNMWISTAEAAGTGLQPFCQGAAGKVLIGTAGVCPVSALAVKDVIGETGYGLDELMETTFVDYTFKKELNDGRTHTGPVADWIEKNMPNLVIRKDGEITGYDYVSMIGVLGQSIKESYSRLSSRMDAQDRVINQQQREIDDLLRRIDNLTYGQR